MKLHTSVFNIKQNAAKVQRYVSVHVLINIHVMNDERRNLLVGYAYLLWLQPLYKVYRLFCNDHMDLYM